MKWQGLVLVLVVLGLPIAGYSQYVGVGDNVALVSQCLGAIALVMMALIQVLATRLTLLESVFGAYDRIYQLHKWLGITALGLLFLHNSIDADVVGNAGWFAELGESFGGTSFNFLQVFILLHKPILTSNSHWFRANKKRY